MIKTRCLIPTVMLQPMIEFFKLAWYSACQRRFFSLPVILFKSNCSSSPPRTEIKK